MHIADFVLPRNLAGIAFLLLLTSPTAKAEQYPNSLLAFQACMADAQQTFNMTTGAPWFSTKYRCISQETYQPGIYNMRWVSQTHQTFYDGTVGWGTFHEFDWPYQNVVRTEKAAGYCPGNCGAAGSPNMAGNPIEIASGNKFQVETDVVAGSGLDFVRYYNSQLSPLRVSTGPLGPGWTHTYDRRIELLTDSGSLLARAYRADGKVLTFFRQGDPLDPWLPSSVEDGDVTENLMQIRDRSGGLTGWRLVSPSPNTFETYDADGALTGIQRGAIFLVISQAIVGGAKRPLSVRDSSGRELTFQYRTDGRLIGMVGPDGTQWAFNYNSADYLESATQGGSGRHYLYAEPGMVTSTTPAWALTGIVDESSLRFATFRYSGIRAISTEHAGGVEKHSVSLSGSYAWVTMPTGSQERRQVMPTFGVGRISSIAISCSSCTPPYTTMNYSLITGALQNVTTNGVQTTHDIDALGFDRRQVQAVGTSSQRTVERDRHADWAVPVETRTKAANGSLLVKETFTYNSRGQVLTHSVIEP